MQSRNSFAHLAGGSLPPISMTPISMTKAEIAASWDHAFAAVVPVELRVPMAPAPPQGRIARSWARAFEAIAVDLAAPGRLRAFRRPATPKG